MAEIVSDYSTLEDDFYSLQKQLEKMSDDNKVLVKENAELRQASLDGIAIADAVEDLN
jgi:cell division protein FtsB